MIRLRVFKCKKPFCFCHAAGTPWIVGFGAQVFGMKATQYEAFVRAQELAS